MQQNVERRQCAHAEPDEEPRSIHIPNLTFGLRGLKHPAQPYSNPRHEFPNFHLSLTFPQVIRPTVGACPASVCVHCMQSGSSLSTSGCQGHQYSLHSWHWNSAG